MPLDKCHDKILSQGYKDVCPSLQYNQQLKHHNYSMANMTRLNTQTSEVNVCHPLLLKLTRHCVLKGDFLCNRCSWYHRKATGPRSWYESCSDGLCHWL